MEKYDPNAYKLLTENPIILDFSGCKHLGEIHLVLKEKFGFPDYYGENRDALWDLLDDMFYKMGGLACGNPRVQQLGAGNAGLLPDHAGNFR